jgi:DNA-binding transcriptional MerR regulator
VTAIEPRPAEEPEDPRRAAKSPAAFRTTGEVAEELDLPTHVLRFWESKFPQIRPLKRGGGRRYYRPEDVELLRWIRQCLYQQGYTIRGVQKLLREGALARGEAGLGSFADKHAPAALALELPSAPSAEAPATSSPMPQAVRAALADVRRDLLEIRDLLDKLRGNDAC